MMLRNMVTSLLDHEKIQTTLAKAKEVRRLTDRVIVLAKRGDLHARRRALAILTDKGVVRKLFTDIGLRFNDRTGGFTRIVKMGNRSGDGAPLSVVMLTESSDVGKPAKSGKAPAKKEKAVRTKAKTKAEKETKEEKAEEAKERKEERKKVKRTVSRGESSEESTPPKKRGPDKKGGTKEKKKGNSDSSE
jgi:large subunit ribosomal protein L17